MEKLLLKSGPVVLLFTLYLLVYLVLLQFPGTFRAAFTMLVFSPLMMIYMVISILKDNSEPVTRTFEEYFYQDEDFRRLPGD